jgi:tRNA G26 N,N-dimethylase Trm1
MLLWRKDIIKEIAAAEADEQKRLDEFFETVNLNILECARARRLDMVVKVDSQFANAVVQSLREHGFDARLNGTSATGLAYINIDLRQVATK